MVKKRPSAYDIHILMIGLFVFLFHGAKLNSDVVGIDTEDIIHLQGDFYGGWLNTGRQGLVLIKLLTGNLRFNPYFTGIMTLVLYVLSVSAFFLLWDRIAGNRLMTRAVSVSSGRKDSARLWAWGLGGLLWISHPMMAEQFYFSLQSLEICLCLLMTAASLYLSYRWAYKLHPAPAIGSVVLLLVTFSCYQTFVVLYIFGTVSIVFLQALKDISGKKEISGSGLIKRVIPYVIIFFIAFMLNMLITRLFFSSSSYLRDQILWGKAETIDCFRAIAGHVIKVFTGYDSIFYHWGMGILAVSDLLLLIRFFRWYGSGRKGVIGVTLFFYLALFVTPFMLTVLMGCSPAIRSQLILPAILGFLGYLGIWLVRLGCPISKQRMPLAGERTFLKERAAEEKRTLVKERTAEEKRTLVKKRTAKERTSGKAGRVREASAKKGIYSIGFVFIVAVCLITGMEQAKVTERLYYTDKCRYEQDVALGRALIDHIWQANEGNGDLPIFVVGSREFTGNHSCVMGEVIGRSFFSYDTDVSPQYYWSTRRVLGFLHSLGADFEQVTEQWMWEALEYSQDMPVWPAEGSVADKSGMIIIKLSE